MNLNATSLPHAAGAGTWHLRAMTRPAAKGERFLALAGSFVSMQEIAQVLKARLGDAARRVPTRTLPNWLVRLLGLVDPRHARIVGAQAPRMQRSRGRVLTR